MNEFDRRAWRVSQYHRASRLYAVNPGDEADEPIGIMFTSELAAQVVREHELGLHPQNLVVPQGDVSDEEFGAAIREFVQAQRHPLVLQTIEPAGPEYSSTHDEEARASYIHVGPQNRRVATSVNGPPGIQFDVDEHDRLIGIEILHDSLRPGQG